MYVTTFHRRTMAGTAVLAAAWFVVAAPGAVAAPKPEPRPAVVSGCPIEVHEFAAQLRAAGFTAQAANNATQLTVRDCRAAGF
jgi:hypothetical protein